LRIGLALRGRKTSESAALNYWEIISDNLNKAGWLTAAFGLLGVIIGGAITAGATIMVEERRASREERKEKRKRLIELKRAARLVDEDFRGL
jgi:hypothetical protein